MKFSPLNRNICIELRSPEDETKTESGLLLPDDYKPKSEYAVAKVVSLAPDCKLSINPLTKEQYVVVLETMIEEIAYAGKTFHTVLENHVVGILHR